MDNIRAHFQKPSKFEDKGKIKKLYQQKLIEFENKNKISYDISCRGGAYIMDSSAAIDIMLGEYATEKDINMLPNYVGVHADIADNELRGAIVDGASKDYISNPALPADLKEKFNLFLAACKTRYLELERRMPEHARHKDKKFTIEIIFWIIMLTLFITLFWVPGWGGVMEWFDN